MGYGFNDYFAKPIQSAKLEELLMQYLPEDLMSIEQMKEETDKTTQEQETQNATQELLAIDRELGLSYCMDTEEVYQEMLNEFCKQMESYIPQLDACVKEQDWKLYAFIVHAIKGNALNIGAANFSALSREHENAGREENLEYIRTQYPVYKEVLNALMEQIRQ